MIDHQIKPQETSSTGRDTWLAFRTGWRLLNANEKVLISWLALGVVIVACIDLVAISSVMPVVVLIVESEEILSRPSFQRASEWVGNPPLEQMILWLGAASAVLLAAAAALNIAMQWVITRFSANCAARLAHELMFECLSASYSWFLQRHSTMLTRMAYADPALWASSYVQRLLAIGHNFSILLIAIALVFFAAPLSGIFGLAIVTLIAWSILSLIRPAIHRMASTNREAVDEVVWAADLGFSGIKDIKLSAREDYFTRLYHHAFKKAITARAKINFLKSLPPIVMIFLAQFSLLLLAGLLWLSNLSSGEIAGQMALLLLVTSRFVPALNRLSGDLTTFWDSFPYIREIGTIRDSIKPVGDTDGTATAPPKLMSWVRLDMQDVGYQYENSSALAVMDVSISLEAGKAYGIAGPSGAGKSTLVDLIVGLLTPVSGKIFVDGHPLAEIGENTWRSGIGYVPQSPFIADSSLRQNIAFGVRHNKIDDLIMHRCIELSSLEPIVAELSDGLETQLGDRGIRLSGGQRQRVAIARALYDEPTILVLDEATSALDGENERAIQDALDRLHGDVTTIAIAHRLSTLRRCDEIFLMDKGQIIDQGTFAALASRHDSFYEAQGTESEKTE
jgi:ATP-binding cassette, subfamily B, bacterial PglK